MIPENTPNRNDYIGNDSLAIYDFTFPIQAQDQLAVSVLKVSDGTVTALVLDTDYIVDGDGEPTGGSIELVNDSQAWLDPDTGFLTTGYNLVIRLAPPLKQTVDISNEGSFFQETGEKALDRLTTQDLKQQDEIDRSIKFPDTDNPSTFSGSLPGPAGRASKVVAFDEDGKLSLKAVSDLPSTPSIVSATSTPKTPTNGNWLDMVGNSVDITPGTWLISAAILFQNGGVSPAYNVFDFTWSLANGADSNVQPTPIEPLSGLASAWGAGSNEAFYGPVGTNLSSYVLNTPPIVVQVATNTTLYQVPRCGFQGNGNNGAVTTLITAVKISDAQA